MNSITLRGVKMSKYSACRDKIIGFEQRGFYESPEQFNLELSFCDTK